MEEKENEKTSKKKMCVITFSVIVGLIISSLVFLKNCGDSPESKISAGFIAFYVLIVSSVILYLIIDYAWQKFKKLKFKKK